MIIKTLLLPVSYFAILNLTIVLLGYVIVKKRMILLSWVTLITSIAIIDIVFLQLHPILRMLAVIATTFTSMKVVAVTESYKGKITTLKFNQWFAFAVGWAGMRAQPFETLGSPPLPNAWPIIRFGISRVVLGLVLILIAHGIVQLNLNASLTYVLTSMVLLVGFSLVLHFGLLSISAGTWRLSGVNTYTLFKEPAKALSLTELWGKRWNIAFSEMTAIAIYRPLRNKIGSAGALMVSFLFSGLLHELALSVPVNNGYGLPTLYFFIHGIVVLIEKFLKNKKFNFLENKVVARIWVFFWLIAPMPLLFHPHFINEILWPLAGLHLLK